MLAARDFGYEVLPAGFVAGTGTNSAIDLGQGFINLESGHAMWPENDVSQRMRQRLLDQGKLGPENNKPEVEFETGQYLPLRLAAGIEILAERGHIDVGDVNALTRLIEERAHPDVNPALISDLATGRERLTSNAETNALVEALAQAVQRRAEQTYGLFLATSVEPIQKPDPEETYAVLTEGSTLLKGMSDPDRSLRDGAEAEAAALGQNVTVFRASGMAGVASVALSVGENRKAA